MRRSDRKKAKKKSRWVRPRIRRGFSYRAPESGSPALGKIVPRRRATAMRAYSGQKPPSGSASINISESFFRNFSKNPIVDRSARPTASVMAETVALAAWSAATEPVAVEPAALETEPIADRRGPLRRRYLVCVAERPGVSASVCGGRAVCESSVGQSVCPSCLAPLSPPDAGTALGGRSAYGALVA